MKKVMQYELAQITRQTTKLPVGAQILGADVRSGSGPTIWAVIDDDQNKVEDRKILIMQTGVPIDIPLGSFKKMVHLGTYHENAFGKSFSVFEELPDGRFPESRLPAPSAEVNITDFRAKDPVI